MLTCLRPSFAAFIRSLRCFRMRCDIQCSEYLFNVYVFGLIQRLVIEYPQIQNNYFRLEAV